MVPESTYSQMKANIPQVKHLFQTRHYVQCASLCERLMTRGVDQIHPIHFAYLNFYLAMSHDTIAREATIKNRSSELDLAEQHYLAAIAALTPPKAQKLDDIPERSPTSPSSEDEHVKVRRVSDASQRSLASSTTSLSEDESEVAIRGSNYVVLSSMAHTRAKRRPAPIITPNAVQAYHEEQFSADLSSFVSMVKVHLNNVRDLKATTVAPTVRFSFARSRSSTMSSRPVSRDSSNYDESDMDKLRWARRSVNFRPRFDPASVQQLCLEALSEL